MLSINSPEFSISYENKIESCVLNFIQIKLLFDKILLCNFKLNIHMTSLYNVVIIFDEKLNVFLTNIKNLKYREFKIYFV